MVIIEFIVEIIIYIIVELIFEGIIMGSYRLIKRGVKLLKRMFS